MNWPTIRLFLKGAGVAFAGGVLVATAAYFSVPGNVTVSGLKGFIPIGIAAGSVALAAYLQRSPLGQWKFESAGGIDRRGGNPETITVKDVVTGQAPAKLPVDVAKASGNPLDGD
jgi:hypothetical protein